MPTSNPDDLKVTPRDTAETEEQEVSERSAAERGAREADRREPSALDDPREDEGWTQPESSAQKGAIRDDSEG